jgi:hypothetical protein
MLTTPGRSSAARSAKLGGASRLEALGAAARLRKKAAASPKRARRKKEAIASVAMPQPLLVVR